MHCPVCNSINSDSSRSCVACGGPLTPGAVAVSPDALPAGAKLQSGNFTIEKVLGQGGFGITYLVTDNSLGRRAAIKEFFPSGCSRQALMVLPSGGLTPTAYGDARRRFLEEARHLARFYDSGIVSVHSVFEENNTAYMVMEYLQGQPLTKVLHERGGRLSEDEALDMMRKVGQSLEVVHAAGLLHRDIKPDNIVRCADGRVVLIDFGTARDFAAGSTQGHTVAVTPGYAPLEQYASRAERGIYTDIYGLSATLYYLLTGEVPTAASDRAMGVLLPPLEQLNPQVSSSVARTVMQGMQIEVAKRPQSVREFLDALEGNASSAALHGLADWNQDAPEDEVIPTAGKDMTDADLLTYVATHHKDLLQSPDHDVQRFLKSLAIDSAAGRLAPVTPGSTTFPDYIQARQDMLDDPQLRDSYLAIDSFLATAQPQPTTPVAQNSTATGHASPDPQLKPVTLFRKSDAYIVGLALSVLLILRFLFMAGTREWRTSLGNFDKPPNISEPAPYIAPAKAALSPVDEVRQRYDQWEQAWTARDLQKFMSLYAPEARISLKPGSVFKYQEWQSYLQQQWTKKQVGFFVPSDLTVQAGPRWASVQSHQVEQRTPKLFYYWTRRQTWNKRGDIWVIVDDRIDGPRGTGHYKIAR